MNNTELCNFVLKFTHDNSAYWFGTIAGMKASNALLAEKTKQYPAHYGSSRTARYKADIKEGKKPTDCSGLIKGALMLKNGKFVYQPKYDIDLYAASKKKGPIKDLPEVKGLGLYKPGHVAVYLGNGLYHEASSFANGIRTRKVSEAKFTKYFYIPYIEYKTTSEVQKAQDKPKQLTQKIIDDLAHDCILGKYGNYPDRKHRINSLGYGNIYTQVQKRVNLMLYGR